MGQTLASSCCAGRGKASTCISDAQNVVDARWEDAHKKLPSPSARVPSEVLASVNACAAEKSRQAEHAAFLKLVFETSTALMLPAVKSDLGKHCFGYGCLMADEFYFDTKQPAADKLMLVTEDWPYDPLAVALRRELDEDWETIPKDGDGRVTGIEFVLYCTGTKYVEQLGGVVAVRHNYEKFLSKLFQVCIQMSGTTKGTLGRHCFCYAMIVAGEFYFAAAQQSASPDCGCSTPVKDVLLYAAARNKS